MLRKAFRAAAITAAAAIMVLGLQADRAAAERPLLPADGVRDPVFAVLLGFVLDAHEGDLDSTRIRYEVERTGRKARLPYKWIQVVNRSTGASPESIQVSSLFDREIDLPVPYQILGYHPGSFRGTSVMRFREVPLGSLPFVHSAKVKGVVESRPFTIEDVRLYILEQGTLEIDIDGWLDRIAGGKLDDTRIAGLVIFRRDNQLFGMAIGYNRDGDGRSGTIAFADDKILYPNPPELKTVARALRTTLESYAPGIAAAYRDW
jgi:hypothetical protein